MRRYLDIIVIFVLILVIISLSFYGGIYYQKFAAVHTPAEGTSSGKDTYRLVEEVINVLTDSYVEKPKKETLLKGAAKGVVEALNDPYSNYLDKDHYQSFKEETEGSFEGIGIYIGMKDVHPVVISVIPGTPAEEAKLQSEDLIIKVDSKETQKLPLDSVIKMIKGPEGTKVKLSIMRQGETKLREIELKLAKIRVPNVVKEIIGGKYGYIRLHSFSNNCGKDFKKALDELVEEDIEGLVIDLRDNGGGLLEEAVYIASLFVKEGTIVTVKGRNQEDEEVWDAQRGVHGTGETFDMPVTVLVNGGSASASEILAGALKDHKRAKLVGEKTFGKGSVQNIIQLSNGEAMIITTAKYYTPNGISIHGKGIEPNIPVAFVPPKEPVKPGSGINVNNDNQLKKAIEELDKSVNR